MDSKTPHTGDAASRHAIRRRRLLGALVVAALAAIAGVVAATRSGGPSAAARHAAPARDAAVGGRPTGGRPGAARATSAPSRRRTAPVPIPMYHVIAAPAAGAPFPGLYVAPGDFAAQMGALKRAGWNAVTLDQLEAHWSRGAPLAPGKPVVLTFDNGYDSQYTRA